MGIFDKVKKETINSRLYEEKLYEAALEEFENNDIRKGLYAKALSKADGDKEKANGIYLRLRVQSIRDEIDSEQINNRETARAYEELQRIKELDSVSYEESESDKINNELKQKWNAWYATYFGKIHEKFRSVDKDKLDELFKIAASEIDSVQLDTKIWAEAKSIEFTKGHNAAIFYYIENRIEVMIDK